MRYPHPTAGAGEGQRRVVVVISREYEPLLLEREGRSKWGEIMSSLHLVNCEISEWAVDDGKTLNRAEKSPSVILGAARNPPSRYMQLSANTSLH